MENKPTILFLAGMNVSAWYWQPALKYFPNYNVLILNNPGIDGEPIAGVKSVKDIAKKALKLMDESNVKTAHVVGHSMGGFVAQELALMAPERINKLVLVSTCCGQPRIFIDQVIFLKANFDIWRKDKIKFFFNPYKLVAAKFGIKYRAEKSKEFRMFVDLWNQHFPNFWLASVQIFLAITFFSVYRIHKITAKTLVIHGEEDTLITIKSAKIMANKMTNSIFWELPEIGHFPAEEYEGFYPRLKEFLEE